MHKNYLVRFCWTLRSSLRSLLTFDFAWKVTTILINKSQPHQQNVMVCNGGGGGAVKLNLGLEHASYSLPKEQALKLIFFATWMSYFTKLNKTSSWSP